MKNKEVWINLLTAAVGAVTVLWIIQPVFWAAKLIRTSQTVIIMDRAVENQCDISENAMTAKPDAGNGRLMVSPEEDFYNSVELMARCVEAEAGNQGLLGKRMVADVILNRVRDEDFPDTIIDVITEKQKAYAFTSYGNGRMDKVSISEETWDAVWMELKEVGWSGLLYFNTDNYSDYGTPWNKIGDHYFSTK